MKEEFDLQQALRDARPVVPVSPDDGERVCEETITKLQRIVDAYQAPMTYKLRCLPSSEDLILLLSGCERLTGHKVGLQYLYWYVRAHPCYKGDRLYDLIRATIHFLEESNGKK